MLWRESVVMSTVKSKLQVGEEINFVASLVDVFSGCMLGLSL
jgi:hypothetical protein